MANTLVKRSHPAKSGIPLDLSVVLGTVRSRGPGGSRCPWKRVRGESRSWIIKKKIVFSAFQPRTNTFRIGGKCEGKTFTVTVVAHS